MKPFNPTENQIPPVYGSGAIYKEKPGTTEQRDGVVPLDSLPAQWWNWLWNNITNYCNQIVNPELIDLFNEIKAVLTEAQMNPDAETTDQLKRAISYIIATAFANKEINGHSLTTNVDITKDDIGLGNVGNFKAVSTVAGQGLTDTEKSNARANIGAGTSSFSGNYNDLTNKPNLASVATSGSYNDLTDKPTIPSGVVVDDALSSTSTNPVQNKVVNAAIAYRVPENRTINGHPLNANVSLSATDVGALASSYSSYFPTRWNLSQETEDFTAVGIIIKEPLLGSTQSNPGTKYTFIGRLTPKNLQTSVSRWYGLAENGFVTAVTNYYQQAYYVNIPQSQGVAHKSQIAEYVTASNVAAFTLDAYEGDTSVACRISCIALD